MSALGSSFDPYEPVARRILRTNSNTEEVVESSSKTKIQEFAANADNRIARLETISKVITVTSWIFGMGMGIAVAFGPAWLPWGIGLPCGLALAFFESYYLWKINSEIAELKRSKEDYLKYGETFKSHRFASKHPMGEWDLDGMDPRLLSDNLLPKLPQVDFYAERAFGNYDLENTMFAKWHTVVSLAPLSVDDWREVQREVASAKATLDHRKVEDLQTRALVIQELPGYPTTPTYALPQETPTAKAATLLHSLSILQEQIEELFVKKEERFGKIPISNEELDSTLLFVIQEIEECRTLLSTISECEIVGTGLLDRMRSAEVLADKLKRELEKILESHPFKKIKYLQKRLSKQEEELLTVETLKALFEWREADPQRSSFTVQQVLKQWPLDSYENRRVRSELADWAEKHPGFRKLSILELIIGARVLYERLEHARDLLKQIEEEISHHIEKSQLLEFGHYEYLVTLLDHFESKVIDVFEKGILFHGEFKTSKRLWQQLKGYLFKIPALPFERITVFENDPSIVRNRKIEQMRIHQQLKNIDSKMLWTQRGFAVAHACSIIALLIVFIAFEIFLFDFWIIIGLSTAMSFLQPLGWLVQYQLNKKEAEKRILKYQDKLGDSPDVRHPRDHDTALSRMADVQQRYHVDGVKATESNVRERGEKATGDSRFKTLREGILAAEPHLLKKLSKLESYISRHPEKIDRERPKFQSFETMLKVIDSIDCENQDFLWGSEKLNALLIDLENCHYHKGINFNTTYQRTYRIAADRSINSYDRKELFGNLTPLLNKRVQDAQGKERKAIEALIIWIASGDETEQGAKNQLVHIGEIVLAKETTHVSPYLVYVILLYQSILDDLGKEKPKFSMLKLKCLLSHVHRLLAFDVQLVSEAKAFFLELEPLLIGNDKGMNLLLFINGMKHAVDLPTAREKEILEGQFSELMRSLDLEFIGLHETLFNIRPLLFGLQQAFSLDHRVMELERHDYHAFARCHEMIDRLTLTTDEKKQKRTLIKLSAMLRIERDALYLGKRKCLKEAIDPPSKPDVVSNVDYKTVYTPEREIQKVEELLDAQAAEKIFLSNDLRFLMSVKKIIERLRIEIELSDIERMQEKLHRLEFLREYIGKIEESKESEEKEVSLSPLENQLHEIDLLLQQSDEFAFDAAILDLLQGFSKEDVLKRLIYQIYKKKERISDCLRKVEKHSGLSKTYGESIETIADKSESLLEIEDEIFVLVEVNKTQRLIQKQGKVSEERAISRTKETLLRKMSAATLLSVLQRLCEKGDGKHINGALAPYADRENLAAIENKLPPIPPKQKKRISEIEVKKRMLRRIKSLQSKVEKIDERREREKIERLTAVKGLLEAVPEGGVGDSLELESILYTMQQRMKACEAIDDLMEPLKNIHPQAIGEALRRISNKIARIERKLHKIDELNALGYSEDLAREIEELDEEKFAHDKSSLLEQMEHKLEELKNLDMSLRDNQAQYLETLFVYRHEKTSNLNPVDRRVDCEAWWKTNSQWILDYFNHLNDYQKNRLQWLLPEEMHVEVKRF